MIVTIIWLSIAAVCWLPFTRSWFRHGSTDGLVKPGNKQASVVCGLIFALGWPVLAILVLGGALIAWIEQGNLE